MKRVPVLFCLLAAALLAACTPTLKKEGWDEEPYAALQALLSDSSVRGGYAVFDCDNTTILHDVTHTLMIYQIEHLRFALAPEHDFVDGLDDADLPLPGLGLSTREMGASLAQEYHCLKENWSDSLYLDFRARFLAFYHALGETYSYKELCLWEPSLAAGFPVDELKALGKESIRHWLSQGRAWEEEWVSPDGRFKGIAQKGLVLTDYMKDLYRTLPKAGIKPFICSASLEWLVEILACDPEFGLSLSPEQVWGVRTTERPDGSWALDESYPQPFMEGKVACINQFIAPEFGGAQPLLVAGDSNGDVAMLTAYPQMKVGLIVNHFRGGEIEALAFSQDERYVSQHVEITQEQRLRQALAEMPQRAGGCYHSYEASPSPDTPAPAGYKPFYISHYGRHGSRFHTPRMISLYYPTELLRARSEGKITPAGEQVLERMLDIYASHEGYAGELSPRGAREHQGIGKRMARRFPQVFASGRDSVRAIATHYSRCGASMKAFGDGLLEECPGLEVASDAGEQYDSLLSHEYISQKEFFGHVAGLQREMREERIDADAIADRLFTDGFETDSLQNIAKSIYIYGCQEEDLDFPEKGRLFDFFSPEELFLQWTVYSDALYGELGNSREFGNLTVPVSEGLLEDIIFKADRALQRDSYMAADLRFGHDNGLVPLLFRMGIEGYTESLPLDGAWMHWPSFERIPMASNIQLVFYRKEGAEVLVKLLFNEKEITVPSLTPVTGPYYSWEGLKKHWSL